MASVTSSQTGQARYYHDKKNFIAAQIRLLEASAQLPSDWRRGRPRLNDKGEELSSIPDSVVSSVMSKLHSATLKSQRLLFNNQSIRQLLEQLEANQHELRRKARQGGIIIRTKSKPEILNTDWIDMFPVTWEYGQRCNEVDSLPSASTTAERNISAGSEDPTVDEALVQKYSNIRSKVVALQEKHQSLQDKHDYYMTLWSEIKRLDAGEIQRNILSHNSPVIKELEKTRALLPKIIRILSIRKSAMIAKRKSLSEMENPELPGLSKRPRLDPSSSLDALKDLLD